MKLAPVMRSKDLAQMVMEAGKFGMRRMSRPVGSPGKLMMEFQSKGQQA